MSKGDPRQWARALLLAISLALVLIAPLLVAPIGGQAQAASIHEKVIIDTDIGMSIDDAFAVALALNTPELEILGFTATSGDTIARAKILDRMLGESRIENIPVLLGIASSSPKKWLPASLMLMQRRYGEAGFYAKASHDDAVDYTLAQIKQHPGEITLVTIGPLSTVSAMIDEDIDTVRKLKKLVIMGGWVAPLVDVYGVRSEPAPEHNLNVDIEAARKVFQAGVPLVMVPLDATMPLKMNEVDRKVVFAEATPLTNAVAVLYTLWGHTTPILHDVLAVAVVTEPQLCPLESVRIIVDAAGMTKVVNGTPNAQVCMRSEPRALMDYFLQRIQHGPMAKE